MCLQKWKGKKRKKKKRKGGGEDLITFMRGSGRENRKAGLAMQEACEAFKHVIG